MKEDEDTMLTYCGFIRFLRTDLRHSSVAAHVKGSNEYRRVTKDVAMGMMTRAESFTKIILAKRGNYVRLSVHPSSGAVKLSIPLVPQRGENGWPR
jgi:pyoverdine/dityrosine biosynthesis protein Dit1